jgi:hypothetical protein
MCTEQANLPPQYALVAPAPQFSAARRQLAALLLTDYAWPGVQTEAQALAELQLRGLGVALRGDITPFDAAKKGADAPLLQVSGVHPAPCACACVSRLVAPTTWDS